MSLQLEWKVEEAVEGIEEDPGERLSTKPPVLRKRTEKSKRQGGESEEEVTVTTVHQPLTITEIQASGKESAWCLHGRFVTWLLQCWDTGANSQFLDGNKARQLGSIAEDSAADRGISRCLDGVNHLLGTSVINCKGRASLSKMIWSLR